MAYTGVPKQANARAVPICTPTSRPSRWRGSKSATARPWWAEELDYRWFLNVAGRRPMPLVRLVPPCPASAPAREIAEGMYRFSVYASDVYFVTSRR